MDCVRFQSLIGILVDVTEKKLTPVSSDIFVSIPNRDLVISPCLHRESPSNLSLACPAISHDLFNLLNKFELIVLQSVFA